MAAAHSPKPLLQSYCNSSIVVDKPGVSGHYQVSFFVFQMITVYQIFTKNFKKSFSLNLNI